MSGSFRQIIQPEHSRDAQVIGMFLWCHAIFYPVCPFAAESSTIREIAVSPRGGYEELNDGVIGTAQSL